VRTALIGSAWAALVLAGLAARRPAMGRVRAITGVHAAVGAVPPTQPVAARATAVAAALGRLVHRAVGGAIGRPRTPTERLAPPDAARLGGALLVGAATAALAPLAAPAAALVAWGTPVLRRRRAERRRLERIATELPEVVDLLVLAVDAGLTVPLALEAVARRSRTGLAAHLGEALADAAVGRRLADALDDVPGRAGEATRPLVAALTASERYGAPIVAGLGRLADDVRLQQRRRAEEAARRVPVKLLFPLVTCTLPAFALLTVVPLIASALGSLRL
jgi:tight adherence protein C